MFQYGKRLLGSSEFSRDGRSHGRICKLQCAEGGLVTLTFDPVWFKTGERM